MNKIFSTAALALVLIAFASCEKTTRDASVACINVGTTELKANKTVRFMNCSKNYDYTGWLIVDANNQPVYIAPSDTIKHLQYTLPAGTYTIGLNVWQGDSLSLSGTSETIVVTP